MCRFESVRWWCHDSKAESSEWTCVQLSWLCSCQHSESYCDSVISLGDERVSQNRALITSSSLDFHSGSIERTEKLSLAALPAFFLVDRSVTCFLLLPRGRKSKNMWFFPSQRSMNERRKNCELRMIINNRLTLWELGFLCSPSWFGFFHARSFLSTFIHESASFPTFPLKVIWMSSSRRFSDGWAARGVSNCNAINTATLARYHNASLPPKGKQSVLT